MAAKKVLHVDKNHPALVAGLKKLGYENVLAYKTPLAEILKSIATYNGLIIRSRFPIDKAFLDAAQKLEFIGRVGAGLENIDVGYAASRNIHTLAAPEGNRNAVGEHSIGMLLSLMNKLQAGHHSIQNGLWLREVHRGNELEGKTVGIIGYGNTGKSFALKLQGFNVRVLCYDIKENVGDAFATQVPLKTIQQQAQILSLHTPETPYTQKMIDSDFIHRMKQPFWLLNTARGSAVVTSALVKGLRSGKILGAGLDVLEYESRSFADAFHNERMPEALQQLLTSDRVLLSPHVGGWTVESHRKLAETIVSKIKNLSANKP